MVFGLFQQQPPLDEPSIQWIFDAFDWALRNFDAEVFRQETLLVTPSNKHFPGRAENPHEMAKLIFDRVQEYAGMQHWPFQLLPPDSCLLDDRPQIVLEGRLRGSQGVAAKEAGSIPVYYDPRQVGNPEVMIATLAHGLAHYLGSTTREPPPGGEENRPHVMELLAVFMGFGLMFANSSLSFPKGGCRSCGPSTERQAYLSQYDITYALALFAVLKGIADKEVLAHLKKSLRPFFKKSLRDVRNRVEQLQVMAAHFEV
ncbi:MAG: hypothetical protein ABW168_01995 [Sedimenticola sp.]